MGQIIINWWFDTNESILRADCFVGLPMQDKTDSQFDLLAMTNGGVIEKVMSVEVLNYSHIALEQFPEAQRGFRDTGWQVDRDI